MCDSDRRVTHIDVSHNCYVGPWRALQSHEPLCEC